MALDLDTIKTVQGLLSDMTTTANFLAKLRDSKEISFTVGGVTTKITPKGDEEAYQALFNSLNESNYKKLSNLRDSINKLLYNDSEVKAAEKI